MAKIESVKKKEKKKEREESKLFELKIKNKVYLLIINYFILSFYFNINISIYLL